MLLPLFFISGAEIESINMLGTIIDIKNPSVVKISLILCFIYFLWRYWQYYQEETYVKDMCRDIKICFYMLESKYLTKIAREKSSFLNSDYVRVTLADPKYSWGGRLVAIPENKEKVIFPFMRKCEFYIYPADSSQGHKREDVHKFHECMQSKKNWEPLYTADKDENYPSFYKEYIQYSIFRFYIMRLIGFSKFMLHESYFTDYLLPFVIATTSAAITIYAVII